MATSRTQIDQTNSQRRWVVGAVSFLNTKPLIDGLDRQPGITLKLAVPAELPALLEADQADAVLVPAVDFGRNRPDWHIISDGCIASDGQTMTVRIFSRVPPDRITTLHVDGDSHTSVVLAQVLWRRLYERALPVRRIDTRREPLDRCQAVLLIGDKVVSGPTRQFGFEVDLGGAWKQLTGLPFVFAVWAGKRHSDLGQLPQLLDAARDRGVGRAAELAKVHGPANGWPVELAAKYLTQYLSFALTPRHHRGLELFFEMAEQMGLLRASPGDLAVANQPAEHQP
ncbi:MAG TPA: menaquinone biosynthesis protein [Phycisphaerae bacterium]|nr:menaquinone biosynthesis protein [Phycisphaerae bacterium]